MTSLIFWLSCATYVIRYVALGGQFFLVIKPVSSMAVGLGITVAGSGISLSAELLGAMQLRMQKQAFIALFIFWVVPK